MRFPLVVQDNDYYLCIFKPNSPWSLDLGSYLHRLDLISKWLTPKQGGADISHILPLNAFWFHEPLLGDEFKLFQFWEIVHTLGLFLNKHVINIRSGSHSLTLFTNLGSH